MRVTIFDVRNVSAEANSASNTHWAKVYVTDGGFGTRETEIELVLFFPSATEAARFADAVNRTRRPERNFVLIDTASAPDPAA